MFAEKHYPENLQPAELDTYLAKGWYRMGQTIFTTHFLCFGDNFYSAIWIRLPLEGFSFSKKLRKLLNRNDRLFRVEFGDVKLNKEKEQLYHRYKNNFPGVLASSLKEALLDGEEHNIYDTKEVRVYAGDQLVAASFFDVGKDTAASILGMYDPDYRQYSLGFYTMLLEIHYCQQHGIPYYYPGYIVPGYKRFDYKLRIGDVEYYDLRTAKWQPYNRLKPDDIPITTMQNKLAALQESLSRLHVSSKVLFYPLFEANLFSLWRVAYFDYPVLLHCCPGDDAHYSYIVAYDVREEAYILFKCSPFEDVNMIVNETYLMRLDRDRYFAQLLVVDHKLWQSNVAMEIADILRLISA